MSLVQIQPPSPMISVVYITAFKYKNYVKRMKNFRSGVRFHFWTILPLALDDFGVSFGLF
jgi:hypothetical protein